MSYFLGERSMRDFTAPPSIDIWMPGNFLCTLARMRALRSGDACCDARASALRAWLASGIGYDRSGPAKVLAGNAFRLFAVSLPMTHQLLLAFGLGVFSAATVP